MNVNTKMTKKMKLGIFGLLVSSMLSLPAFAAHDKHTSYNNGHYKSKHHKHDGQYKNRARVVSAKPIYEKVLIRSKDRYCGNHRHDHRHDPVGGRFSHDISPIAGAVIGSAIGHQFGSGSGNKAATIAGAVIGGVIASEASSNNGYHRHQKTNKRRSYSCNWHRGGKRYINELVGYKVKYKHKGHIYKTRTRHHPGKFITFANGRKRH